MEYLHIKAITKQLAIPARVAYHKFAKITTAQHYIQKFSNDEVDKVDLLI